MFEDEYRASMYAPKHDYRAYDLHSRERVSLAEYIALEPGGSLGRRVEVVESADGPDWHSSKSRYYVEERDRMSLRLWPGSRAQEHSIHLPQGQDLGYQFGQSLARWSGDELIDAPTYGSGGSARP